MTVSLNTIQDAARLLEGVIERTPCAHSKTLSALTGAKIWIKFENLQYTGSFKERGAYVKLSSLSDAEKSAGVIAMSAGNHAQGVAYAAQSLNSPATIVIPLATPFVKVQRTREFGADVILDGANLSDAAARAHHIADTQAMTFIHPFDDPLIIAGQGTIGLEILEDVTDLDVLVVPVGGGGLIAGIAIAAKALKPEIEVIGAEAALIPSMRQKLYADAEPSGYQTIAEGIAVERVSDLAAALLKDRLDDILLLSENSMEHAICLFLGIEKTLAEGAGAAALAAVIGHPDRFRGRKVGLILSGGNIDSRLLASVLMRDMARDGRIARLRLDMPDIPGALGQVCNLIGEQGGNIIDVSHQRVFSAGPAKQAELVVAIETRDRVHMAQVIAALTASGRVVTVLDSETQKDDKS
ncbi:MAG TPA: threonine ammonia-lyase [Sneathiellales bacterium]|nr:threonine ammonia-lyase [Sneathiellales bacterium]